MNSYFENPLYRKAFFEDTDRIMAGFQNDFALLKSGAGMQAALKNIHRYAHSLKGLFAMMEFKEIQQIAANLESAVGLVLKDESASLDENLLADMQTGFAKIEEALRKIQNDLTRMDAPA